MSSTKFTYGLMNLLIGALAAPPGFGPRSQKAMTRPGPTFRTIRIPDSAPRKHHKLTAADIAAAIEAYEAPVEVEEE